MAGREGASIHSRKGLTVHQVSANSFKPFPVNYNICP